MIVAEADGTQADLVNTTNGWLIEAGNQGSLTAAIEDALGDSKRLRAKGKRAFQVVREKVNLEAMVSVFSQSIMSVLE